MWHALEPPQRCLPDPRGRTSRYNVCGLGTVRPVGCTQSVNGGGNTAAELEWCKPTITRCTGSVLKARRRARLQPNGGAAPVAYDSAASSRLQGGSAWCVEIVPVVGRAWRPVLRCSMSASRNPRHCATRAINRCVVRPAAMRSACCVCEKRRPARRALSAGRAGRGKSFR